MTNCFFLFTGKAVLTTSVNGKIVAQLETDNDLEAVAFSNKELGYLALGKGYFF